MPGSRLGSRYRQRRLGVEALEDRTLCNGSPLPTTPGNPPALAATNRILVRFRPDGPVPVGPEVLAGTTVGRSFTLIPGLREVRLDPDVSVVNALAAYKANPAVLLAQPDSALQAERVPNDPLFGSQWALRNTGQTGGLPGADIHAPDGWDRATGRGGVVVAVLDTGLDMTHPDLAPNLWVNPRDLPGNGLDDDGNGFVDDVHGYDFVNNDADPTDDNGHGTHVAGVLGAAGNNGQGIAGVIWTVQLMPVKFLDANGLGFVSGAIAALGYAVANGASISNNSWTGGGYDPLLFAALDGARAAGHLFVTAAGNDGSDTDLNPTYPAAYGLDNILTVAATDETDSLARFSNFGAATVDLGAPGVNVLSTVPGGYDTLSGTSMAAPHVAGAAALLRDLHPDWDYRRIIRQILDTVDPIPVLEGRTVSGGRLNLARALDEAVDRDLAGPFVVQSTPSGSLSNPVSGVRVSFNEPVDEATLTAAGIQFTGPGGPIVVNAVTPVAGSHGTRFDLTFAEQSAKGTYRIVLGPQVSDRAGNRMNQNRNGVNGENPADQFTATFQITEESTHDSNDVPTPVADLSSIVSYLTIDRDITIASLKVRVNITHPEDGDLLIYLISPTGLNVTLASFHGAGGADYADTFFDDAADAAIGAGTPPFPGSYRPDRPLSALNGTSALGTWQLWVEDHGLGNEGRLNSWSLVIQAAGDPPPPPPSPLPPSPDAGPVVVFTTPAGPTSGPVSRVEVAFSRPVDPASFTPDDVQFTGPNGPLAVASVVAEPDGRRFSIYFAPQAAPGAYRLVIGPQILGTNGKLMDQDGNGTGGEEAVDTFTAPFSLSDPAALGPRVVFATPTGDVSRLVARVTVAFTDPMDLATLTTADILITGPGGRVVAVTAVEPVPATDNHAFTFTFAEQTESGTYRVVLGPDIRSAAGRLMNQDGDATGGEGEDAFPFTFNLGNTGVTLDEVEPITIRDLTATVSTLVVAEDIAVGDLNVVVRLTHARPEELRLRLVAPDGTSVRLSSFRDRPGPEWVVTWDDQASGDSRPEEPLAAFNGRNARGTWQLVIEDFGALDEGTLQSWLLVVQPGENPPPPLPAPAPLPQSLILVASAFSHGAEYLANFVVSAYHNYLERTPTKDEVAGWVRLFFQGQTQERVTAGFLGSAEYSERNGLADRAWLEAVYRDLLSRGADESGLSDWLNRLAGGATRADVAFLIAASAEYQERTIRGYYDDLLGRTGSAAEVAGWLRALGTGLTQQQVLAAFVGSEEYFTRRRRETTDWLFGAYRDLLGRNPDNRGYTGWLTFVGKNG